MDKFNNLLAQHQMYAHRASSAVVNEAMESFAVFAQKLRSDLVRILDEMSQSDIRAFTNGSYKTAKSKVLRDMIEKRADDYMKEFGSILNSGGADLAAYESEWMMKTVTAVASGYEATVLKGSEIYARAMSQPIVGYLFKDTMTEFSDNTKRRLMASIRSGITNGDTNNQLVKAVVGTKQFGWKDGTLNQLRIAAERTIRTVRNHIAVEAYDSAYEALGIERVIFQSVIDGRTSLICSHHSGEIYNRKDPHPVPPLHPNCRSVLVPYDEKFTLGMQPTVRVNKDGDKFKPAGKLSQKKRDELGYEVGQVQAGTSYGEWFARQDASFQRDYLGKSRYELYSKGDLKFDRFTDPTGKTLTLAELKIKDAEAFKRAGL